MILLLVLGAHAAATAANMSHMWLLYIGGTAANMPHMCTKGYCSQHVTHVYIGGTCAHWGHMHAAAAAAATAVTVGMAVSQYL